MPMAVMKKMRNHRCTSVMRHSAVSARAIRLADKEYSIQRAGLLLTSKIQLMALSG